MNSNTKILVGNVQVTTTASQVTAIFDTIGFGFAKIIGISGITDSISSTAATNNSISEGDTTSSFATFSSGLILNTDWTSNTATNSTSIAKIIWGVPTVGRKRYLKATFTITATSAPGPLLICELSEAGNSTSTMTTNNAGNSPGF